MSVARLAVVALLWSICICVCVDGQYDYNYVSYAHFCDWTEFTRRFMTLDGGAAFDRNMFVGVGTQHCITHISESTIFQASQKIGGVGIQSVSIDQTEFPDEFHLNGCAEVLFYEFNSTLLSPSGRTTELGYISLSLWMKKMLTTKVELINNFDYPVALTSHQESGVGTFISFLNPGATFFFMIKYGTVIRAVQAAYNGNGNDVTYGDVVDFFAVQAKSYSLSPLHRQQACDNEVFVHYQDAPNQGRTAFPDLMLAEDCPNMVKRFQDYSHKVLYTNRIGANHVQASIVRAVTDDGFKGLKLPKQTHEWLLQWWHSSVEAGLLKIEVEAGPSMNQYQAPTEITILPDALMRRLSQELYPFARAWYGGELELTSIYGVRRYGRGSILRMHVDTASTHVVSAIINVDQRVDEGKDWKLLILDHEGVEHELSMLPGDMLLYESAKLLHGRPQPFEGDYYDNIFIHYKPTRNWDYDFLNSV